MLMRIFRPTIMSAYGIDNLDIGVCFALYGFVALGAYLFGGPLADRFLPRKLMGSALVLTALGGIPYALFPTLGTLKFLYAYWGVTSILLFWSAMIKATRVWGGDRAQGRAFGLLDGGRGLVGVLFSTLGYAILRQLSDGVETGEAFGIVVLSSSAIIAVVGVLVWFFLKMEDGSDRDAYVDRLRWADVKTVLRLPTVWLLMVIILCAYVGYRVTDLFSLYAQDVMGFDEVAAAGASTFLLVARPVVGVGVGFLADRRRPSFYLIIGFALMIFGALPLASGWLEAGALWWYFPPLLFIAVGVYAGRVLYYAVLREGNIPLALTGTAVGLVAFIGYTPDIFANLLFGYYLDNYPGAEGHRYVFLLFAGFALVGLVASVLFRRLAVGTAVGSKENVEIGSDNVST